MIVSKGFILIKYNLCMTDTVVVVGTTTVAYKS